MPHRGTLVWLAAVIIAFAAGIASVLLWPDHQHRTARDANARSRCLGWFADLESGRAKLDSEQREFSRAQLRVGTYETLGQGLARAVLSREETCARAARFGLVGSDGSLGPLALAILFKCELVGSQPSRATKLECDRIDEVIGRDPDRFG